MGGDVTLLGQSGGAMAGSPAVIGVLHVFPGRTFPTMAFRIPARIPNRIVNGIFVCIHCCYTPAYPVKNPPVGHFGNMVALR